MRYIYYLTKGGKQQLIKHEIQYKVENNAKTKAKRN